MHPTVRQRCLQLYQTYGEGHRTAQPVGFVYNRNTQGLKLLFSSPILLPTEEFIPLAAVLDEPNSRASRRFP
ncbi:hypothetical protein [Candidatus Cyanaurora vandensis]|uniref:hypothetical protein n=1 Tax=Candidatus Cyanaurora vandensis TaxID=2714958 RepID=UPI00257D7A5C|nr:hypothetical protein [Candidatus Cyanaurora vandensis]